MSLVEAQAARRKAAARAGARLFRAGTGRAGRRGVYRRAAQAGRGRPCRAQRCRSGSVPASGRGASCTRIRCRARSRFFRLACRVRGTRPIRRRGDCRHPRPAPPEARSLHPGRPGQARRDCRRRRQSTNADLVLFDHDLTPSQLRNLERGCPATSSIARSSSSTSSPAMRAPAKASSR